MNQNDYEKFEDAMRTASVVFRDKNEMTPTRIRVYWDKLKWYSFDDVAAAIDRLYSGRTWAGLPLPAEILQEIRPEPKEPEKHEPLTAEELSSYGKRARFVWWAFVNKIQIATHAQWLMEFKSWEQRGCPRPRGRNEA